MATQLVCDGGCGTVEPRGKEALPFAVRGSFGRRRFYCPECVVVVDKRVADLDALHTKKANEWAWESLAIDQKFRVALPNGKLPDEQ
jgi:hypothetical protein